MANDLRLQWHPDFGAVVCMDVDSEMSLNDVLRECPFVSESAKVCYAGKRRSWLFRLFSRLFS